MTDSPQLPEGFSLDKRFFEERWHLELGTFPAITVDTFLGYAYMQPSVAQANLVIDMDEANQGQNPSITLQVEVVAKRRYRLAAWGLRRGGILGKSVAIVMAMFGAPLSLSGQLQAMISAYPAMPSKYRVQVEVFDRPLKKATPPPGFQVMSLK